MLKTPLPGGNTRIQNSESAQSLQYNDTLELFKTSSMNLPMKDHENKLYLMLEQLKKQLDLDKKDLQMHRSDLVHTQYVQSNDHEDLSRTFVEEMAYVTVAFRKMCEQEQQEQDSLSKQIDQLKQEKNKIQQTANVLEHQIGEDEKVLGVGKEGFRTI